MNSFDRRGILPRSATGKLVLALAFAGLVGAVVAPPARADDRFRHERHERFEHHRHHERVIVAPGPGYVYAPPPVVYPAPVVSPGINLVIPLHIR
jgi:hypothetical protein